PRANGTAERFVQTSIQVLKKFIAEEEEVRTEIWDRYIHTVQAAINRKQARLTESSPFALMFGRKDNAFRNYRDTESRLMTYEELKQHWETITSIVYPKISKEVKAKQEEEKKRFGKEK